MCNPLVVLLALAMQEPADRTARTAEPLAIGASAALVLLIPSAIPSLRVSLPLSPRFAADIDVGQSVFGGARDIGQVLDGYALDSQVRWLRNGRQSGGRGRYWIFGGSYAQGRRITQGMVTRDYGYRNLQAGYGWDQLRGQFRAGFELKVSIAGDGEGLARLFIVWGSR
jgi:hypothetical protein